MPTIYLLGLGWANGWVLFECAHYLPTGYEPGKLFQNPQLTHNVPTEYIALCPQCLASNPPALVHYLGWIQHSECRSLRGSREDQRLTATSFALSTYFPTSLLVSSFRATGWPGVWCLERGRFRGWRRSCSFLNIFVQPAQQSQ